VDGDAPRPKLEAAVGLPALRQVGGQVGILDHFRAAIDGDHHAEPFVGGELLDHLERYLGVGLAVVTEEGRVGDLDQRVVHLEVEERADAPFAHLVQATALALGALMGERGERAAVAVGTEGDVRLVGEQHLTRRAIDGRHLPLNEEAEVFQPEPIVLVEEADGRLVVVGAGHHVERQRFAVAPAHRDDLLGVDLEEAHG
jgi:hypothetical protein